jgi:hypothetical protein
MPITQIPFQDPVAPPPPKPQPEQLGLYDSEDWEEAYRDLDARVPHLLIQLQDDLARSRKREAVWISIIVHLVIAMEFQRGSEIPLASGSCGPFGRIKGQGRDFSGASSGFAETDAQTKHERDVGQRPDCHLAASSARYQ